MSRFTIGLFTALMLCGCVSTKTVPVDAAATSAFQGRTLTTARRGVPDFAAMTAGKAMFGMIGAGAMISAGNKIVRENAIEDPADSMASALVADLERRYGVEPVDNGGVLVADEDPARIAKQYAAARYLLDVRTVNWGFLYFPTDWNSYAATLGVKLRVIDTESARVIAESYCYKQPEKTADAPSLDEMTANRAERLKAMLRALADHCLGEFRAKTLKL